MKGITTQKVIVQRQALNSIIITAITIIQTGRATAIMQTQDSIVLIMVDVVIVIQAWACTTPTEGMATMIHS